MQKNAQNKVIISIKSKMMPNITNEKKQVRNLFQATQFFLTIPHFDKLDEVYDLLSQYKNETLEPKKIPYFIERKKTVYYNKFPPKGGMAERCSRETDPAGIYSFHSLKNFAIVLETHTNDEEKGKHLHIYIEFSIRREISPIHFDFLGKHGNLQRVKSEIAVLEYMRKENKIRASFDVLDRLISTAKSPDQLKRIIYNLIVFHNWEVADINIKFASRLAFFNIKLVIELAKQARADFQRHDEKLWMKSNRLRMITQELIEKRLTPDELVIFKSNPKFQKLIDVINRLLIKGNQHDHKQCTVSLVGHPSIGKTTFVNALAKYFISYYFPVDGWHSEYQNHIYEMWIWHEWDFRLISKSDFLLLTEGERLDLKVKFSKTTKLDRPLIILTANEGFELQTAKKFSRDAKLQVSCRDALATRIEEFNFYDSNIHFLIKLLVSVNEDI